MEVTEVPLVSEPRVLESEVVLEKISGLKIRNSGPDTKNIDF